MKGFIEFNSLVHTVEQNIITYRNIISPFANIENINQYNTEGKLFVDTNYGHVYDDYYLKGDTSIYGPTELIPEYSGDRLANYGFLRVPFRKIPRILVHNRQELMNILSSIEVRDRNLRLLYRGQFSEYPIERDAATLKTLYGSSDVIEPSLVTSAARNGLRLENILPSWMAILNIYIENILDYMSEDMRARFERDIINFQSGSNFNAFALAMAQHYGLPSVGLDVTPDIDVALFFALRKFTDAGTPKHYKYVDIKDIKPSKPPVIYIMAPTEDQQLDYRQFKPHILPFLRPDQQTAHFMHTGWGLNKNFAATRIFIAIYLNPEGDFGKIKEANELFPKDDSFAELIDFFKENRRHKDDMLDKFLETFYLIE